MSQIYAYLRYKVKLLLFGPPRCHAPPAARKNSTPPLPNSPLDVLSSNHIPPSNITDTVAIPEWGCQPKPLEILLQEVWLFHGMIDITFAVFASSIWNASRNTNGLIDWPMSPGETSRVMGPREFPLVLATILRRLIMLLLLACETNVEVAPVAKAAAGPQIAPALEMFIYSSNSSKDRITQTIWSCTLFQSLCLPLLRTKAN